MKKVLFATTALVMTAGVAAAEVSLSGSANMGLKYDGTDTNLHWEIDFGVNASGETDNGLTFGASIDLDTDVSMTSGEFGSADGEVYIGGAFGTLTVGNVDSAADQWFGATEVGFDGIGLDDEAEGDYYVGNFDVLYTYSMDSISVALSANSSDADDSFGIGFKYAGPVTVVAGYSEDGTDATMSLGVSGSAAGFGYNVVYVDSDDLGESWGIGGSYAVNDALTLSGGVSDNDGATDTSYGIGFSYGLGGGATLAGGIGSIDGTTKADLGINMSF